MRGQLMSMLGNIMRRVRLRVPREQSSMVFMLAEALMGSYGWQEIMSSMGLQSQAIQWLGTEPFDPSEDLSSMAISTGESCGRAHMSRVALRAIQWHQMT